MNLSRPDRADRLDSLAAEYALGTMPPRARARMARVARGDPQVAGVVHEWEERLSTLAAALPGIAPPPRVWARLSARLGLDGAGAGAMAGAPAAGWWNRLAFWRGLTAAGFAAVLALGIALYAARPVAEPPLVAVLAGADGKPALIASAKRDERFLLVKAVGAPPADPGKALELWMLPQGQPPRSLGVLPAGALVRVPLAVPSGVALAEIPALAVSLEPAGGSPTGQPTGPVLYSGRIERMY